MRVAPSLAACWTQPAHALHMEEEPEIGRACRVSWTRRALLRRAARLDHAERRVRELDSTVSGSPCRLPVILKAPTAVPRRPGSRRRAILEVGSMSRVAQENSVRCRPTASGTRPDSRRPNKRRTRGQRTFASLALVAVVHVVFGAVGVERDGQDLGRRPLAGGVAADVAGVLGDLQAGRVRRTDELAEGELTALRRPSCT